MKSWIIPLAFILTSLTQTTIEISGMSKDIMKNDVA